MIPSFYTIYSKNSLLLSANTYEKDIVSKEYCIGHHSDKMSFLPTRRYQIILIGEITELLQKKHAFCFNYQPVDCQYTFFKYQFSGKYVVKSGQVFEIMQRRADFTHQNKGWYRMPSSAKRDSWGESIKTTVELLSKD